MSAQKSKKGLLCFLFLSFLSMLFALVACSTNSEPNNPSGQQGVSSVTTVTPSSDSSGPSSSSEAAVSSDSEDGDSSDSEDGNSSDSEDGNSSDSAIESSSSRAATSSSSRVATSSSSRATSSSSRVTTSSSSRATSSSSSSPATGGAITTRSWTNVDYASTAPAANKHNRQRLDLKLPSSGDGPFPLILYVHGGGFTGGDWELSKNQNGLISSAPSKGYAVASAGYLLYQNGKASFPQMVEDILAAIRHLRANASTYHLDPDKFVIAGFSAGGYLTNIVCALSGATHTYDVTTLGNAGVSSNVQAAASSSGLTDFSKLVEQSGSTMHNTMAGGPLGGNLTDNTDLMKNNLQKQNPLNYVSANTPPLYMRHGTSDNIVPYQQSKILFEKIKSVTPNAETLGKVKYNEISGGGHADFASGSDTPAILEFLDKALGR